MKKNFVLKQGINLVSILMFLIGCSKDSGGPAVDNENPGQMPDPIPDDVGIVSGNPVLNEFLITSDYENVLTLDADTGQETIVYAFENLTDVVGLADYENGRIYVATDDNAVNAIDVDAKSLVWDTPMLDYKFGSLGISDTVCVDGVCYASGGYGVVVALNQDTGDIEWYYSTDPDGELDNVLNQADTPIVHGDKVYVFYRYAGLADDIPSSVHVLDKETGSLLNLYEVPFEITDTPTIVDNMLYLPAKNLYAINLNSFNVLWTFEANGVSSPSVSGGRLVVQAEPPEVLIYSRLYCLEVSSGAVIWEKDTGFNDTLWNPVIVEDVVFGSFEGASVTAFSKNGRPFAVNLADGREFWYRERVSSHSHLVYANGRLFFLGHDIDGPSDDTSENSGMICMDANTGEVLWINPDLADFKSVTPVVVADNGVFGPSYYRGR